MRPDVAEGDARREVVDGTVPLKYRSQLETRARTDLD
jgi:hypothetical protein